MSSKAMVAVCDILGFGKYVKKTPLEEIIGEYIPNIKILRASSIPNNGLVGHALFSDTILLYSTTDDRDGYEELIYAATRILARPLEFPYLRFRMGIAYGEFYSDEKNSVYVGKALIEAHELEKKQEWCGAAFTATAEERILEVGISNKYLIHYDVPIKDKDPELRLVIDWTKACHKPKDKQRWLYRNYGIPASDEQKDEQKKVERKISNTEKFHFDKCVQCRSVRKNSK